MIAPCAQGSLTSRARDTLSIVSDLSVPIPKPHYLLFETERNELPAVVVLNEPILTFEHPDVFPWQLEIVIEVTKTAKNGMPTAGESKVLDELGDKIESVLQDATTTHNSTNILFLARVTGDSQRELVYRVHDPELANRILERSVAEHNVRDWSFTMFHDGEWSAVQIFRDLKESAE